MEYFQIKRGDTSPKLRFALDPVTQNIAGASVRFQMRSKSRVLVVDEPATIVSELPGVVEYEWREIDTQLAGVFEAEFKVTYADGGIETFPNTTFIFVRILEDVR
jgi:hypothetical protein